MGMIILLFLSVFLEFPPFLLTLDKAYVTKPFHLTGANISNVFVPYFAFDQCKPYHSITHDPKVESRNFGLYFLTKHQGGHCDEGILICYPGTLMRNHMISEFKNMSEFKVKRTFQVGNKKNDSLSLKCAEKTEQFVGLTDPEQWRGIKVYTKLTNSSNPLSTRELILETSLTNRSYTFESMTRQLSLNFGTRISLFTWVTTHFGQPFDDEEFNTAEQYAKQMGQGPFLEEHVGLWLLGMDMLPWMAEEYVSLYVYRSCSCTMDAWFTRPTDENDPIEPVVPSAGSSQCRTKQMDETFELGQLDAQHLQADLVFTVLTDEKWQNFTVEFLSGGTDLTAANSTDNNATVVMTMIIGTTDDMEVSFPGMGTTVVNGTQMPNGTQELRFDIFLLEHWFVIMVNGKQLGDVFWPNEWWHGEAWKNITAIRLNGQMLLLYGPELDAYSIENENFNFSVPLPFSTGINGLHENSSCFFRVQMLNWSEPKLLIVNYTNDKSASDLATFSIILYNNGTSFNTSFNNDTSFSNATSFNTSFNNDTSFSNATSFNNETIALEVELHVFYDGKWLENEHRNATITFKNISVFELFFGITKGNDVIKLNGVQMFEDYSNSAPYCDMKKIEVTGNVILLDEPELNVTSPKEKNGSEISNFALKNVVNYGQQINIITKERLTEDAKIIVRLTHNSPDCSKYDVVAQFEFIVTRVRQTMNCKHKLRKEGNVAKLNDGEGNYQLRIYPKAPLYLEIVMAQDGFYAKSPSEPEFIKLCPYYLPVNLTEMPTPPWTIDHVQVYQELVIANFTPNVSLKNAVPENTLFGPELLQIDWKPIDYLKINKSLGSDGDLFSVFIFLPLAKKLNAKSQIEIAFFNNALEIHEIFGTNLLNIKLLGNQLGFLSWSNKTWKEHGNYTLDFTLAQETGTNQTEPEGFALSFTISLIKSSDKKMRLQIALDGQLIKDKSGRVLESPEKVTIQDIQYITVSHSDIELAPGQKIMMSCKPEEKCTQ
ncbi:hypothetical protein niasHS_003005 [Heterodera schachtii]|uniref:Uncharacterized protein n=1 Tax=Heterodera schachtii TaxID=97005 RepID=A0ABD2KA44_HETSC